MIDKKWPWCVRNHCIDVHFARKFLRSPANGNDTEMGQRENNHRMKNLILNIDGHDTSGSEIKLQNLASSVVNELSEPRVADKTDTRRRRANCRRSRMIADLV